MERTEGNETNSDTAPSNGFNDAVAFDEPIALLTPVKTLVIVALSHSVPFLNSFHCSLPVVDIDVIKVGVFEMFTSAA